MLKMRYAGYIRVSHDEQRGNYSLDAQTYAIKNYIAAHGGQLIEIYVDEAQTATTTQNRDNFLRMRSDAKKKKFEALVVAKFDRLNRNRIDAIAVKSLLRRDLGIKVFSVTEPSEDSDGEVGGLMESMFETLAEWYSKNLSEEYRKGKREVWRQGRYNGGKRLLGYIVGERLVLQPKPDEVSGVLLAFESYATGKYGYVAIAKLLNEAGYMSTSGRQFTSEAVREILKNPTYIGKLPHQETRYDSSGKITKGEVELSDGQHKPIVPLELWERIQRIRQERDSNRGDGRRVHSYLLRGLLFCWRCYSFSQESVPEGKARDFGKCYSWMQHKKSRKNIQHYFPHYYCKSSHIGYSCTQKRVRCEKIDSQVLDVLFNVRLPADWQDRIARAVALDMNDDNLEHRLNEIRAATERIDFRWDQGFFPSKDEYVEKRKALENELASLMPIANDDSFVKAADLIGDFKKYWAATEGDVEAQNKLLHRIIDRVYLLDNEVIAITFKAEHHLILAETTKMPAVFQRGHLEMIPKNTLV